MMDPRAKAWAATAAAAFGLLACQKASDESQKSTSEDAAKTAEQAVAPPAGDKECCIGKNDCKGKGGCAVDGKNSCAGKNDCKGQGGCNMHCPK